MSQPNPYPDLATLDLRGQNLDHDQLIHAMPRAAQNAGTVTEAVESIIAEVRGRGFAALAEYAEKFDGVAQQSLRVPQEALTRALAELPAETRAALEESIRRLRAFSEAQAPADTSMEVAPGAVLEQRWVPVRRVGLYVPGGLAVYPSSVMMNVVPAQAAGVGSIALASPPQREFGGLPHPLILATAALLGIDEVYAMGGAQAIAAFAYGVQDNDPSRSVAKVDVITGPGNVFVATAKRLVQGAVGIDAEAGATEIAILADDAANPAYVAADLISQAEHDPNAGAVLITPSTPLAEAVRAELARQIPAQKNQERITQALSGTQSAVIMVDSIEQGIDVANAYGAEHLEIQTEDAEGVASRITSAGAVFIGNYAPVSLGDYAAGSNHVLPTSGTAAFASGLNTTTFLKAIQTIQYSQDALLEVMGAVEHLAEAEYLPAHARAVAIRFDQNGN
ncbi:histidinol dehydrogenase [Haematomicrobium sanguinis]|uniref:histidinol dehydrogenase n=1 Tax=Haematomicrobium sanguinis TaxID=479106 RepID=UPI00047DEFFF|nr:histidinol dehydrogenase [Haematomicrobium sanguinis]